MSDTITLDYVSGVEGNSVYLNAVRIAGPKPWGGGKVLKSWTVKRNDVLRALHEIPWEDSTTTTLKSEGEEQ